MKITADFNKITGRIKPMHGVGQPPMQIEPTMYHYLTEAGIPCSRLHDVGGIQGSNLYADVPNIFRDFDADENLPESYDFAFTDVLIKNLIDAGVEPFFRLGVTIENYHYLKAYRIFPPKNPEKWARVCEHIIRHYNEGWANGFTYGIKYWEVWNEPDDCHDQLYTDDEKLGAAMWKGTPEQYFRLYEVTSNHLKNCFGDKIKVGGYASCGFYAYKQHPDCEFFENAPTRYEYFLEFMHKFFKYITSDEHKSPLDFFSWHSYCDVHTTVEQADYCRRMLDKYGFSDTEDILNEWNTCPNALKRSSPFAAASTFAMMLGMQKKKTAMLNFYDARIGQSIYGGLFNPDTWRPYKAYYALMSFNKAYVLENEVETSSDNENVYVCGAAKGSKAVLLISNLSDKETDAQFCLSGVDTENVDILMTNDEYMYTDTGKKIKDGHLTLLPYTCVEIRLNKQV